MFFCVTFVRPRPSAIYTLSLHDALPIYKTMLDALIPMVEAFEQADGGGAGAAWRRAAQAGRRAAEATADLEPKVDRKSTRLNSSHVAISYAVFCLKKKKKKDKQLRQLQR